MDFGLLTQEVVRISEAAAEFIRSQAGKVTAEKIEVKSLNSLVSYVDKEAEKILVTKLQAILPHAGFITEEGTVETKSMEYMWVIDPLDGTTNFLQQIPVYSVSIGLLHEDRIILGVVNDVEHKEVFYAWRGGGAWCNGHPIKVSDRENLSEAVVATGFPYAKRDVLPQLTLIFDYFLKHARGIRRLGSAAIDLAYVACGRFDAYYETSLNAWDIAGGIIIVEEAGGVVSDFAGKNDMLQNGQLIAAPKSLHKEIAANISSHFLPNN
jgi:myo-inositol-1(or 4)-monophosphatase